MCLVWSNIGMKNKCLWSKIQEQNDNLFQAFSSYIQYVQYCYINILKKDYLEIIICCQ